MNRRILLAIGWTIVILIAVTVPGSSLPNLDFGVDKIGHFGLFAIFGWLWMWAIRLPVPTRTWWVLTGGFVYAGMTEIYQGLLPWPRIPSLNDAIANMLGLLVAVQIFRLVKRFRAS